MTRSPLVRIIDEALPSPLFKRLLRGVRALGTERLRTTYQTSFWHPWGEAPTNLVEMAAKVLAPRVAFDELVGVEWWLSRMKTSNVGVDFHQDRDNAYFDRTGRLRHPRVSSVLYLTKCRGGLLAVTRQRPNPKNPAMAPSRSDFDLVAPSPNRFTCFDGRLTHGVLDANNEIPGRRLPPERSFRLAIAINWWARRPEGLVTYAERGVYGALAL